MSNEAGRLIGGRYRLAERIGSGGMGTVWRALDQLVEREVAVKQPRLPGDPEDSVHQRAANRLYREARAAARVEHPAAVSIHDVVVEDGLPWIVMELIRGESLHDVLQRGALAPAEAARIGLAVVGALDAAHAVGIVHRDVKPANVLLGRHGRVVLTDFGIAHIQGEESLTMSGEFVGSLEFIAPERMSGRGAGPASDLWSLGVLLYAAVEGWSPFRRTTLESTLAAILSAEPPQPQQAGPLGPLIVRLLAKEPDARPDAKEVTAALEAVAEARRWPVPDGHRGPASDLQEPSGLREFADDAGTVRLGRTPSDPAAGTAPAKPGRESIRESVHDSTRGSVHDSTRGSIRPKRPRPVGRVLSAALAGALLVVGGVWLSTSFGGGDNGSAVAKGGAATASGSPSVPAGTWVAHREKAMDAILSVPVEIPRVGSLGSGADHRDPSQKVVYGDGTVQLELTRQEDVPTPITKWAAEATTSWSDDNARTLNTPTSFHGYRAMLTDTTYEVKEKKYRVMQLLIITDRQEYYELRVDMPKGTRDEKRGTSLFKGARGRLEAGKTMLGS